MKAVFEQWKQIFGSAIGLVGMLAVILIVGVDLAHQYAPLDARQDTARALSLLLVAVILVGIGFLGRQLAARFALLGGVYVNVLRTTEAIVWEADAADFRFVFVSERAERLLGYSASAWRQPGFWPSHLHPDDRCWVEEYCAVQNAQLAPYQFEFRFQARDGKCLWLQNIVTVVAKHGKPWRLHGLMIDISERKKGEQRLQHLLAEKEAILDNAIVGIAFVRSRRIVSCNRRCEVLFHYGPGELDGAPTAAIFASNDIYADVGARAYSTIAGGETFSDEVQFKYKDGTLFWGAITGRAVDPLAPQDASVWIFADISNRRDAIEESRRLRRAVEQSPVSILITDRAGTIEYVNPKFTEVTGFDRDEAVGATPRILRSGNMSCNTYQDLWDTILAGNVWRGELHNRRCNGELFWEDATIAPVLDDGGAITHFIAVKEDITERKHYRDELARHQMHLEELVVERTHALESALDDARAADRTKDAFLANVSHEMRTPLHAVIGLSALALANAGEARQRDYLEKIAGAGETMLAIIDDLLDLTKIAAGRIDLDLAAFGLRPMVARLIALMGHRASERGLELRLEIAAAVPDVVVGDALRLHQVLMNLLSNAIKFTASGHVTLTVAVLAADAEAPLLRFAVADTGIGIVPEAQRTLFTPFTQADSSITRRFGGTGLGLAICKRLVDMMGGTLAVDSSPGLGSTFSFQVRLPVASEPAAPAAPESEAGCAPHFKAARVLLADDQPLNRQIVTELLVPLGIAVDQAENGRRAVEILEGASPGTYDLVLMDVQMPEMDGLSATRRLRAQPDFAALPVIAMTAHALSHERAETVACGMNDHLGKPFTLPRLYEILRRWLPAAKRTAVSATAAAPPVPVASLPAIPDCDFAGALHRCGGNEANYRGWLRDFLTENADTPSQVAQLCESGQMDAACRQLHALKGRSGMLGLTALAATTAALETALRAGTASAAYQAEFGTAFAAARAAITQIIDSPPVSVGSNSSQEISP